MGRGSVTPPPRQTAQHGQKASRPGIRNFGKDCGLPPCHTQGSELDHFRRTRHYQNVRCQVRPVGGVGGGVIIRPSQNSPLPVTERPLYAACGLAN